MHPFPSLLNGVAVLVMAMIAGGSTTTALRLGGAMVLIQFAIGTLNDIVDAPRDGGRVPAKPIASGLIGMATARRVAVGAGVGGLILAAPSGSITFLIACLGLGCGVAYDLALSRTPVSWLPLAFALPLVPVFAWYGAVDRLPGEILTMVPIAVIAGTGLAIGNALVDHASDAARGRRTVAVAFGPTRGWVIHGALIIVAVVLAVVRRPQGGGPVADPLLLAGSAAVGAGVILLRRSAGAGPRVGWGLEAAGLAAVGIAWVVAAARP
ncbi:MAG: UbiA family prenyltransferase [Chloroflexota bacterium]